ncbi:hypothetical protein KSP40_PGU003246 [Platanthera guangdongensis]|uniref:Uncharacterized protein n=1 Tax=Platanthera guangdongensis TaxID=2320717 RepID=A0ABR2N153_9ASPA
MKFSLGDAQAYYLSTTKNELGVVSAQSIAVPKMWKKTSSSRKIVNPENPNYKIFDNCFLIPIHGLNQNFGNCAKTI